MITVLVEIPQAAHRLVIESVCQYFAITVQDFYSMKRTSLNAYRRAVACYVMKDELQLDNTTIGTHIGMPRTTVDHNIYRIEREKRVYCQVVGDLRKIATTFRILQKIQDEWLSTQQSN